MARWERLGMKAELLVLYVRVNFGLRAVQTCSIIAGYILFICWGYCFDCWMRQTNHFKSLPGRSLVSNHSEILQPHNEFGLIWIDKKAWFQPFNKHEGFARPRCQVSAVCKRACLRNCSCPRWFIWERVAYLPQWSSEKLMTENKRKPCQITRLQSSHVTLGYPYCQCLRALCSLCFVQLEISYSFQDEWEMDKNVDNVWNLSTWRITSLLE